MRSCGILRQEGRLCSTDRIGGRSLAGRTGRRRFDIPAQGPGRKLRRCMWDSRVVTIQSAVVSSAAFRYADLMSMVAMWSFRITASCINKKVSGMMVGL